MIVICKKANKRLIKGCRYEVDSIWNNGSSQSWLDGKIQLVGFGRYSVDNFTDTDGNPIQKINYKRQNETTRVISFDDVKVGDILVCNTDHYKTMIKDGLYKIEDLKEVEHERVTWSKQKYKFTEKTIKFEGIKRYLKFSGWYFRKLTPEESREISLNTVLNNEGPDIITTKDIRKIDMAPNKEKLLMDILSKSILDNSRHHLSVVGWGCEKIGTKIGVKESDFEDILNMSLRDILDKIG